MEVPMPEMEETVVRICILGTQGTSSPIHRHQETPKQILIPGNQRTSMPRVYGSQDTQIPRAPVPREPQILKPPSLIDEEHRGLQGIPNPGAPISIYVLVTGPKRQI